MNIKQHIRNIQRRLNKIIHNTVIIYSANGAGVVNGKAESLKSQVLATNANIVTVQEMHTVRKWRIKMQEARGYPKSKTRRNNVCNL